MSTSSSLDFENFYSFDDPLASRPFRITVRGYSDWVTSKLAWEFFRGTAFPNEPVKLGWHMGGQFTDFLWSDQVFMFSISNRVKDALSINKITGWTTYPVEVFGRKQEQLQGYHGFSVIGAECRRDKSGSQILTRQAVPGGLPYQVYKGLFFHMSDWDGSDIFLIKNHGIVVTRRVHDLFTQAKISNVKITPLVDVEIDMYLDKFEHDN